ncbi:MAG: hypothetical protein U0350_29030 [Caldilineaceae bacterium]
MAHFFRATFVWLVVLACLQTSCTSLRPVAKIGLLAPFEGLYRRTGYTALAAMRSAIAENSLPDLDLLPLALDDSRDPQRAAQKLLVDQSVRALVGPQNPFAFPSTLDVSLAAKPSWILPFEVAPDTNQFAEPRTATAWATDLIATVAAQARHQQAQRLVLAGWMPGWPQLSEAAWTAKTGMPVRLLDDAKKVVASDAVFWLGSPDGAAVYLGELRKSQPSVPFWLGLQGGDPVFVERAKLSGPIFWATWLGDDYAQWAAHHEPATPFAYLVYRATRQSIAALAGHPNQKGEPVWRVQMFSLDAAGKSEPLFK